MDIVLHTGAQFTEEGRLLKCLLRNKESFAQRGIAVPGPGKYRQLISQRLAAFDQGASQEHSGQQLLGSILEGQRAKRVILSLPNLFGLPKGALRSGFLYPRAAMQLDRLQRLFAPHSLHMFMALRNPATLLPDLAQHAKIPDAATLLAGVPAQDIRWSHSIKFLRSQLPQVKITIWSFEDAPFLWAQIIREMAGLAPGEKIIGGFDLLSDILSPDGMAQFRGQLKRQPSLDETGKRRLMVEMLEAHGVGEKIEAEVDFPGWSAAMIEQLTQLYEADLLQLAQLPNLRLLVP